MVKEQQMFEVIKLPFIWSTEQWFADLASSLPVTSAPFKEYTNSQLDYQHTRWLLNCQCFASDIAQRSMEVQKMNQYPQRLSKNTVVICVISYQCRLTSSFSYVLHGTCALI